MLLFSISKHIVIFSLVIVVVSTQEEIDAKYQNKRYAGDLPNRSDIWKYVNALEKIINFCMRNKNEVDMNLYFGLFLVNVNLKPVLKDKSSALPLDLRVKVNGLVKKCSHILKFFDQMVQKDMLPGNKKYKLIYTLMNQEDDWLDRMNKYHMDTWKQPKLTPSQKEHKFSNWNKYLKDLWKFEKWAPSPDQSDSCLVSLAKNPHEATDTLTRCKVDDICYLTLLHGNDFGYALTHRLVLMVLARMGRGCYIFTPEIDSALVKRFCGTLYSEATFIAENNYTQAADLLFEQITMCSLNDQTHFLRRSFIGNVQALQDHQGCLRKRRGRYEPPSSTKKPRRNNGKPKWQLMRPRNRNNLGGDCNRQLTSVAASALASAVRFILNTFY